MKYGVFSDVHGNLEALEAALQRLQAEGAEQYIFCGDLIGYGPDPQACVQLYGRLADEGRVVGVKGNHDAIFSHPDLREYFNIDALTTLDWSRQQLTEEAVRRVSFLPEVVHGEQYTVVHGTPRDPIKEYFAGRAQYRALYEQWQGQVLFVGHTHVAGYMEGDAQTCRVVLAQDEMTLPLRAPLRYVINAGSVGKPRNHDVRAAFGLWDTEGGTFRFLRAPYDYAKTQEKMKRAGLPEFLIVSLAFGI